MPVLISFTIVAILILVTFMIYIKLSMEHQQKLIDKLIANSYKEYKLEQRADKAHNVQLEMVKQQQEEERDPDYL